MTSTPEPPLPTPPFGPPAAPLPAAPSAPSAHAPGWFPDPAVPGQVRWFDGARWTPHTAPARTAPSPRATVRRSTTVAWVLGAAVVAFLVGGGLGALVVLAATSDDAGAVSAGAGTNPSPDTSPDDGWVTSGPDGDSTCADLRHEALTNPSYYWQSTSDRPSDITRTTKLLDRQDTADTPASGKTLVLVCRFEATYTNGRHGDLFGVVDLEPDDYVYLTFSDRSPLRST
ncbi:DUF2510 domain-containing protein [Luteimicrobium subarcticum]|uniref:Uncharacterized protein DUF2510 n=1 Tax=Luteimicrobium subarcticum TaxID=620910 RepID=A0A2M8WW48_9MICO|nr:DUF2510 domain-containing protein [Luteimicrobium subarcticum]PJI95146.1 uncharacterized protein DUF2510 [Luteimicrobium subarcticum]